MGAQALLRRPGARVFLRASPAAPERPGIAVLPPANTTDRPGWALVQEVNGFSALGVEVGPAVWAHLQDDDWQPGLFPGPVLTGVVPRSSYDDFQVRGFQCYGTEEAEEMLAICLFCIVGYFPGEEIRVSYDDFQVCERARRSPTASFSCDGLPQRQSRDLCVFSVSFNGVISVRQFPRSFSWDSLPQRCRALILRRECMLFWEQCEGRAMRGR